jgi:hypothetical protein
MAACNARWRLDGGAEETLIEFLCGGGRRSSEFLL